MGPAADRMADLPQRREEIGIGRPERCAVDHQRRAEHDQRRAAARALDRLLNRQAADRLHRDRHRGTTRRARRAGSVR